MDKLPFEILHEIFILLHLRQKLECTLVCHQWAHVLQTQSLLHSVVLTNPRVYTKFMRMIEAHPENESKVEYVEIHHFMDLASDYKRFFNTFRRLQIIKLIPNIMILNAFNNNSKNNIPMFLDDFPSETNFIRPLKNLPFLKVLTLGVFPVSLDDMEIIHENMPVLETIIIIALIPDQMRISDNINPSASVIDIKIYVNELGEEHTDNGILWLDYISQKYPSLKSFDFVYAVYNGTVSEEGRIQIYREGILPILKNLGSQLVTIPHLYTLEDFNIFKELDETDCRPRRYQIQGGENTLVLDRMSQSMQAHYIKELEITDALPSSFRWLENLTTLTTLSLMNGSYDQHPGLCYIDINQLLQLCPSTLEDLTIYNVDTIFSNYLYSLYTNYTAALSIKRLTFNVGALTKNVGFYLSRHFPNLKSLCLGECSFLSPDLDLPLYHLDYLELCARFYEGAFNGTNPVSLRTSKDDKPRIYSEKTRLFYKNDIYHKRYPGAKYVEFRTISPEEEEEDDGRYFFKITCASVKTLIVDQRILKQ